MLEPVRLINNVEISKQLGDEILATDQTSEKGIAECQRMATFIEKYTAPGSNITDFRALQRIYKFLDTFTELESWPDKAPCIRGCNHCCRHNVDILQIEALNIESETGLTAQGKSYTNPVFFETENEYDGQLCPFNHLGECQIYDARPIVCRVFFSMEPTSDSCAEEKGDQINWRSHSIFSYLINLMGIKPMVKGGGDIRDFFGAEQILLKGNKTK